MSVFSMTQSENSCLTTENFYGIQCQKGYQVLSPCVRNRPFNKLGLNAFMCVKQRGKVSVGSHHHSCLFPLKHKNLAQCSVTPFKTPSYWKKSSSLSQKLVAATAANIFIKM